MDLEDLGSGLEVREAKLNLAVKAPWAHQRRVEGIRAVGSHENLDVTACIETIKLVHDLKHCSLHLVVSTSSIVKTSSTNGIHFIEKNDARFL